MAEIDNTADRSASEHDTCWRWNGSMWVGAADNVSLRDPTGLAEQRLEQRHATPAPNQFISFGLSATSANGDDEFIYSAHEQMRTLPSHQALKAISRMPKPRTTHTAEPPSYGTVMHQESLSKLVTRVRAGEMQRLLGDVKPGLEFAQRRKARAVQVNELHKAAPARGRTEMHSDAVVESSEPVADLYLAGNSRVVSQLPATQNQFLRPSQEATPASRLGVRDQLAALTEILKQEGNKPAGEIDPATDLYNLAAMLPPKAASSEIDPTLKKLEERIALLETDLRIERGARSTAFHQLQYEITRKSRQWRWACMITTVAGTSVVLAAIGKLLTSPWAVWEKWF
jgi:hypothetical protein